MSPRTEILLACSELRDAFIRVIRLAREHDLLEKTPPSHASRAIHLMTDKWISRLNNYLEKKSSQRWGP